MRSFGFLLWAGASLLLLSAEAHAEFWRVAPGESAILFKYSENDEPKIGRFERFEGVGNFESRAPEEASLELTIEIDSIVLEDDFRTGFVKGAVWFDVESHPTATYVLERLEPTGSGGFQAYGALTIKGRTRAVSAPLTLEIGEGSARAVGRLEFDRFDFRVGDNGGFLVDIGEQVAVEFDLVATGR